jgi:hypothetical protein
MPKILQPDERAILRTERLLATLKLDLTSNPAPEEGEREIINRNDLEESKINFGKQIESLFYVLPNTATHPLDRSLIHRLLPYLPGLSAELNQALAARDKEIANLREQLEAKDKELVGTKQKLEQCLARESEFQDQPSNSAIQTEVIDQIEGEADTGEHTLRSALAKPVQEDPRKDPSLGVKLKATANCNLVELQVLHTALKNHLEPMKDLKALIPAIQSDVTKRFIVDINLPVSTLDPKILKARLLPGRDRDWILDVTGTLIYQLEKAILKASSTAPATDTAQPNELAEIQVGKDSYSPF